MRFFSVEVVINSLSRIQHNIILIAYFCRRVAKDFIKITIGNKKQNKTKEKFKVRKRDFYYIIK